MAKYKCTESPSAKVWKDGVGIGGQVDEVKFGATVTAEKQGTALYITAGANRGKQGWSKLGWFEPLPVEPPPPPSEPAIPKSIRRFWRVKHDIERGALWRPRLPEIFRIEPDHHVVFTAVMQLLWYDLNRILSGISKEQWGKLGGNALYLFNNDNGFPGHVDYVNGVDLGKPLPRAPQMLVCGGALLTGSVEGDRLFINGIDTRKDLPSVYEVIDKGLYYTNVTVQQDGSIGRFPQGDGKDTFTPLFYGNNTWTTERPFMYLKDLAEVFVPSPYWIP